jgi:chorismate lyase / 3-hydroxybenzoate synthase
MTRGIADVVSNQTTCRVTFGRSTTGIDVTDGLSGMLRVTLPVLAGAATESLLEAAEAPRQERDFVLFETAGRMAGLAVAPAGLGLEAAARHLYDGLFAVSRGLHFYRIWNYVPRINACESDLENYRLFCRGRSLAFEAGFGSGFKKILPAGSAVGSTTGPFALGFLCGVARPAHFENSRQVPAFEYPPQYGPRPPSFARATAIADETGRQVFISGTAAINGHQTVAGGDLSGQIDCTLENLKLIARTAGASLEGKSDGWHRSFKIYLRHAADLSITQARLERELLGPGDFVQYLQADICRADLLVEIESVLTAL